MSSRIKKIERAINASKYNEGMFFGTDKDGQIVKFNYNPGIIKKSQDGAWWARGIAIPIWAKVRPFKGGGWKRHAYVVINGSLVILKTKKVSGRAYQIIRAMDDW